MMTIVHRLIWQDYTIELRHVSNWHDCRIDHLEIKTVSPQGAALPITETGYKSHFVDESHLIERGGAVAYDVVDVSEFHHVRINHSELFADEANHINGIENFWNQAKRHLRGYNGIPQQHFHLFIKECEWRFNHRPVANLTKVLQQWWFK